MFAGRQLRDQRPQLRGEPRLGGCVLHRPPGELVDLGEILALVPPAPVARQARSHCGGERRVVLRCDEVEREAHQRRLHDRAASERPLELFDPERLNP